MGSDNLGVPGRMLLSINLLNDYSKSWVRPLAHTSYSIPPEASTSTPTYAFKQDI